MESEDIYGKVVGPHQNEQDVRVVVENAKVVPLKKPWAAIERRIGPESREMKFHRSMSASSSARGKDKPCLGMPGARLHPGLLQSCNEHLGLVEHDPDKLRVTSNLESAHRVFNELFWREGFTVKCARSK